MGAGGINRCCQRFCLHACIRGSEFVLDPEQRMQKPIGIRMCHEGCAGILHRERYGGCQSGEVWE